MRTSLEKDVRTLKNLLSFVVGVLIVYFISVLSSMLIPLALALFLAILLQPVMAWFEQRNLPWGVSLIAILLGSALILGLMSMVVYGTYRELLSEKEQILGEVRQRLDGILAWVNQISSLKLSAQEAVDLLSDMISTDWLIKSSGTFAGTFAGMLGDFSSLVFMTTLYFIGLIGGILRYEQYLHYLDPEEGQENKLISGFEQVKNSIVTYMKIKFLVSLMTGVAYALICWAFGLNFAIFWGFLAFILNFIPTVGSIIATVPPLLLGLIEVDSISTLILMLVLLMAAQNIFGNVVEPRLTGASLSLNTVTVIFGLVFWGYLWGVTGMILSVPLLVLFKVVMAQFPDAQIFVRLMGSHSPQKPST